jgi:hypothetical protein
LFGSATLETMLKSGQNETNCDLFISCPGNSLEQCGCRQLLNQTENLPLIANVESIGKKTIFQRMLKTHFQYEKELQWNLLILQFCYIFN